MLLLILIIGIISISSVSAEDIADISEVNAVDEVDITDYQNTDDASIDTAVKDDDGLEKQLSESKLSDDDRENVSYEIKIPDSVRTGDNDDWEMREEEDYSVCYEFYDDDVDGDFSILIDDEVVYTHQIRDYWDDDEHMFALNDLDIDYGNHTIEVKFDGNENYAPFSVKKVFEYYYFKLHIPEKIIKGDWDYNHCAMICEFAVNATGTLTVYIDNKRAFNGSVYNALHKALYADEVNDIDSHINILLDSLSFGEHNYTVNYTGGNYGDVYLTGSFNLSDYYFEVNYGEEELIYGEDFECEIRLIEGTTQNLILNLNGKNQTIVISGNDDSYYCQDHKFSNLVLGENNFTFTYEDKNLPKRTISFVINVTAVIHAPRYEDIIYNSDLNDNVTLLLPSDAKGNLSVYVCEYDLFGNDEYNTGDLIKTTALKNGFASISLSDLSLGEHDLFIKYEGDDYLVSDLITEVTIVPNIICPTGLYSKNVTKYSVSVESPEGYNGKMTIGVYKVKRAYVEDLDEYEYKPGSLVSEIYNGSAKGKVSVNYPNLSAGNYYLVVKLFNGTKQTFSDNIFFSVRNVSPDWVMAVDIPKEIAIDIYWDEYILYYCPKNVPKDIASGTLTLYIDGEKKSSGSFDPEDYDDFEYDCSGLSVGTHKWELRYTGDGFYNPSTLNGTFKVTKKLSTYIYAYTVTTTYKTSKKMTIELYDGEDKPVANRKISIKLNGKTYYAKTNSKGKASFAVPNNLAPKTYYATLKFAGDSSYIASSNSVKVVVKKATPKLTAKAKTFKVKAKKKYTATLKTDKNVVMKNVKVSITVGKKTYSAKTNSKGVVTLTLSKLSKKGKYTATVKFAGSAYYNAVSRKVKITVK